VSEARQAASVKVRDAHHLRKSASDVLNESVNFAEGKHFDVFLSHSFHDAEVILGVKAIIEAQGKSVYVDWVEDKQLDRKNVTAVTADVLRRRMRSCSSLIYASSSSAETSKWMPWELGYFDGYKPGMVSILPLVDRDDAEWKGQEYLGLYPVIDRLEHSGSRQPFVVKRDKSAQRLSRFGESDSYIWKDVYGKAI